MPNIDPDDWGDYDDDIRNDRKLDRRRKKQKQRQENKKKKRKNNK